MLALKWSQSCVQSSFYNVRDTHRSLAVVWLSLAQLIYFYFIVRHSEVCNEQWLSCWLWLCLIFSDRPWHSQLVPPTKGFDGLVVCQTAIHKNKTRPFESLNKIEMWAVTHRWGNRLHLRQFEVQRKHIFNKNKYLSLLTASHQQSSVDITCVFRQTSSLGVVMLNALIFRLFKLTATHKSIYTHSTRPTCRHIGAHTQIQAYETLCKSARFEYLRELS